MILLGTQVNTSNGLYETGWTEAKTNWKSKLGHKHNEVTPWESTVRRPEEKLVLDLTLHFHFYFLIFLGSKQCYLLSVTKHSKLITHLPATNWDKLMKAYLWYSIWMHSTANTRHYSWTSFMISKGEQKWSNHTSNFMFFKLPSCCLCWHSFLPKHQWQACLIDYPEWSCYWNLKGQTKCIYIVTACLYSPTANQQ